MKIALLPNLQKDGALECSQKIIEILSDAGHKIYIHKAHKEKLNNAEILESHSALTENCDLFIAVGGDGTIIHAAKHACLRSRPVLGVNLGRLGYMAAIEKYQINLLPEILNGSAKIENRMMVDVSVNNGEKVFTALNDAVIAGELSKILDYSVTVNNSQKYPYRADGLIIATPTGSTAYSLSAGGPVVDPQINCMIFTPICPHSLFNRSVIYGDNNILRVMVTPTYSGRVFLTVDGEEPVVIKKGDIVEFSCSKSCVKLIKYDEKSFFDVVNKKLLI